jgi:predicted nucleic acid-binding protein
MKRFADTFYFLALLNPNDGAHSAAVANSSGPGGIVTTEWVLTELGDAMAHHPRRKGFLDLHRLLRSDADALIVPASADLFARGVELYALRADKDWSLTDCISFVVMQDHRLTDALTGDRHFEQAGFHALLCQETLD